MSRRLPTLGLLATLACASPSPPPHELSDGRYLMGTVLELGLVGRDTEMLAEARDAVFAEVERLERRMSVYHADSDVSRLNAAAGREALEVDVDVAALLRQSAALGTTTRGSFDVTVGPLVTLWTEAAARDALPSATALAEARARVGLERIEFRDDGRVALARGSAVNLGGVAKGFALDRARAQLVARGIDTALLNFGQSSTWAIGSPPDTTGWRLLARSPDGGFAGVLTLRDRALSVSGSLGQWSEIEGRRYGHVLDPRSGQPLGRRRQALVVTGDATAAEAFSKALLVLGELEGIALIESQPGVEALLLDESGARWRTSGWDRVTGFEPVARVDR